MDPAALRRLAGRWRVPLATVEKDHAISVALRVLGGQRIRDDLILKGGTALRKAVFDGYQFSEDIDFAAKRDVASSLVRMESTLRRAESEAGVVFERVTENPRGRDARSLRIRYRDMNGHPNSIRVELSLREKPIMPPDLRPLRDPFEDRSAPSFWVLALPEILAEKVRALPTRSQARDLYDLWRLLREGVEFDVRLAEAKLRWRDPKAEFDPLQVRHRIERIEPAWTRDLRALLPDVPAFARIRREVLRGLGVPSG